MPQRANKNRSRSASRGSDQPLMSHWADSAKEKPLATAAAAAGAVAAGVFLWSKRNQISEQISRLSDQISDWSEERGWTGNSSEMETAGATDSSAMETSGRNSSRSGRTTSGKSASGSRSARSQSSGQAMNAGSAAQGVTH